MPDDFHVGVGSNNRDPNTTSNAIRYYDVRWIQLHPKWGVAPMMGNDIALLTLAKPVSQKLKVGRIRLPEIANDYPLPGHQVMAVGWGIVANFKPNVTVVGAVLLQGSMFNVISLAQCKKSAEKDNLPATKICVNSSKAAVCKVQASS